jgi:diguanylate cyclase (GGDEF)-like protein
MDSKIGLVIQLSGVIFITTLMFLLMQSLKSGTLGSWKKGWLSLAIALISLQIGFNLPTAYQPFFIIYYFGEYIFGYFLISGCYHYSTDKNIAPKSKWLLIPGFLLAVLLTFSASDFNNVFNLHTFVIGTVFVISFILLKPKDFYPSNLGWKLMRFSLVLLAIDFYHYTFLFSFFVDSSSPYLAFNPIIDLMLEILLGFGMVIVLLEKVCYEMEETNRKIQEAHKKLEHLAQTDSLTTAFNRHAFYGFLQKRGGTQEKVSGCVGFFDIDDLKPINDQLGHSTGDMVIREVTNAIRSLIRAEDLIFRWGGDEFFVIMISMDSNMARERMNGLTELLKDVKPFGVKKRLSINVSSGFKDFADSSELEQAIKLADEEMYRIKQERKRVKNTIRIFPQSYEKPRLSA